MFLWVTIVVIIIINNTTTNNKCYWKQIPPLLCQLLEHYLWCELTSCLKLLSCFCDTGKNIKPWWTGNSRGFLAQLPTSTAQILFLVWPTLPGYLLCSQNLLQCRAFCRNLAPWIKPTAEIIALFQVFRQGNTPGCASCILTQVMTFEELFS